ncbi:MAG: F0F1 ATP synthase subunit gamma, partial [Candidatus Saganbacteria bacterium]|nr:F0F1 ATP synthase subunit gamma [Candidatus Saganbacteria bacterium]
MSLLKIRNRYRSIKSLNSILTALQMVTVVRMQRAKGKFAIAKDYLNGTEEVLAGRVKDIPLKKKVLVVITSNRGLCGTFNKAVVLAAVDFINSNPGLDFIFFGRKGVDILRRMPEYASRTLFSEFENIERTEFKKIRSVFR